MILFTIVYSNINMQEGNNIVSGNQSEAQKKRLYAYITEWWVQMDEPFHPRLSQKVKFVYVHVYVFKSYVLAR